jgi:O-antigen ligase
VKTSDTGFRMALSKIRSAELSYYALIMIMAILPVHYQYLPPFMILLFISRLLEISGKNNPYFRNSFDNPKILCALFMTFFLWQLLTVLYSEDKQLGWSNVFGRLALVMFPLALFSPGEKTREKRSFLLRIFALSTCLYLVFCFGSAFGKSISFPNGKMIFNPHPADEPWVNYFFELELTNSIHPTYLSLYVLISVIICFESFYIFEKRIILRSFWFVAAVFLIVSLYFISSRAGILASIIVVPVYLIIKMITVRKYRLFWSAFLVMMILMLPFVRNNEKVNNLVKSFSEKGFAQDDRVKVWKVALSSIKKNPVFGVGIEDVRSELTEEYRRNGQESLAIQKLNAHNQFLEAYLEGGIFEIVLLLAIFGFMISIAIKEMNIVYGLYVVMIILFFLFETMLYRLAGIAFFGLFSFILYPFPPNES